MTVWCSKCAKIMRCEYSIGAKLLVIIRQNQESIHQFSAMVYKYQSTLKFNLIHLSCWATLQVQTAVENG